MKRNMWGLTDCPDCGSAWRTPVTRRGQLMALCDDCGRLTKAVRCPVEGVVDEVVTSTEVKAA